MLLRLVEVAVEDEILGPRLVQPEDIAGQALHFGQQVPQAGIIGGQLALGDQHLFGDMGFAVLHQGVGVGHGQGVVAGRELQARRQLLYRFAGLAAGHVDLRVGDNILDTVRPF